jgi:F0F1-type ATP synthase assembly protein I
MTNRQRTREPLAALALGVVLGLVAIAAGAGLWLHAVDSGVHAGAGGESASVAAILFGVFLAICAGHEIWRRRTR